LIGATVWQKLDTLYIFAAADSQSSLLNWKTPGTSNATNVNSTTFTIDRGYTGNGSTMYINSNYNFSTGGGKYTQNNASIFAWSNTLGNQSAALLGITGASDVVNIFPEFTDDKTYWRVNDTTGVVDSSAIDGDGFYTGTILTANPITGYRNGSNLIAGPPTVLTALQNQTMVFLQTTGAFFSTRQILMGGSGDFLTTNDVVNLYNLVLVYMQAVGAQ
jgi:hypothetical protein